MFEAIIVILLGLVVGSFLNVVIHRLPLDQSVVKPGSHCPECKKEIRWYQNIPLASYLVLRGKCANCGAGIHWRYPLVEFVTAVLFYFSWRAMGYEFGAIIAQIRIWVFVSLCIAITLIDLEHRIIPDELSLGGWAFGLLTCAWDFRSDALPLVIASFAGFGFFFLFAVIYEKLTGRMGLGGGDIKFMGTIGIFLGLGGIWASLLLSSIVGSVIGIGVAWWQQKRAKAAKGEATGSVMRTAIPYGPFLVFGALVELYFEVSKWMNL